MQGVLIYTASGDSEGSLGGLVREGEPKNIKRAIILKNAKPNINKITILKPDTKIIVIQTDVSNKVCPRSGWLIKTITINNKTKKEYKYLL